ncbi:MAG: alcohol dehydrogenase catalytic domain-containing protein [Clostridia bacterium]|nr:alcohol dehydrogenase catalytic domain-containing protein [Clostridia bacterium]
MKAVIWEGVGKLRFADLPEPECRPGWVRIKVMAVGLCATEVHIIRGKFYGGEPPHVLGHEICGFIDKVGEGCEKDLIGRRVVVETYVGCGKCEFCRTGRKHLCSAGEIGYPPYNGGDAQYVTVPEGCIRFIPDSISWDEGAIMEAVACPFGAVLQCGMKPGQTVLIQGSGVAGLSFVQSAMALGAGKVFCTARNDVKAALVKQMGGEVIDLRTEDVTEYVRAHTDSLGADIAIDALGSSKTIKQCFSAVKSGGKVVLYGLPDAEETVTLPVIDCILRQISVCGYTGNEKGWDHLIKLVDEKKIDLRSMVSASFPLERFEDALALFESKNSRIIKIVLHPWE